MAHPETQELQRAVRALAGDCALRKLPITNRSIGTGLEVTRTKAVLPTHGAQAMEQPVGGTPGRQQLMAQAVRLLYSRGRPGWRVKFTVLAQLHPGCGRHSERGNHEMGTLSLPLE